MLIFLPMERNKENKSPFREWIERLQQESWELELLISGFTLYGLFRLKSFLAELLLRLDNIVLTLPNTPIIVDFLNKFFKIYLLRFYYRHNEPSCTHLCPRALDRSNWLALCIWRNKL